MNFEIVDNIWWSSLSEQIGAVLIRTFKGYKAYMGTSATGISQSMDCQIIAQNGAKVTYEQAKGMFPQEFKRNKITKKTFIF